jgi:decaprenylphospho-beta-D-ribofuranose 2-oxidase
MVKNSLRWLNTEFTGWGRAKTASSLSAKPQRSAELAGIPSPDDRLIAYGLGRSYGDAALNTEQRVVRMTSLERALEFDREQGILVCEAGMNLDDLISIVLPHGWFVPVTPGTRFVTVGGCIAADVHGKNHHVAGTFSQHVQWLDLHTAAGETIRCSASENSSLFHATAGGMGLTGLIVRAAIKLVPVESAYVSVRHEKSSSLADTMQRLVEADKDWEATVAWIDGLATGASLGRGDVILGRSASRDSLPDAKSDEPFAGMAAPRLHLPVDLPLKLVLKPAVLAFNNLRYNRIQSGDSVESLQQFYYPLDIATGWNRLYGPAGFHQYQFVVPDESAEAVVGDTLRRFQENGLLASLIVLKRFGEGSGGLSFPMSGWTLAVDLPSHPRLFETLDELDASIIAAAGRVYLAKDSRLSPDHFRQMYPDYAEWLSVKREIDPRCNFSSDLSRRLRIDDDVLGDGI